MSRSSEEDPVMKSDDSKSTTVDDDSSGDESSTERGYQRCIQKYSKYLPGGEIEQHLRVKADDEHDDIISKDDDSMSTTERYKQFLAQNHHGEPDEGDDQPIEIIIPKSETREVEDMHLDANEDFHRWGSPDVTTPEDRSPRQMSNLLPNDDLDVVIQLMGAELDSDDETDETRKKGNNQRNAPRGENGTQVNGPESQGGTGGKRRPENTYHTSVHRLGNTAQTPAKKMKTPQLTSDVLGSEDMEVVNMMLGEDQESSAGESERAFQETYPNIIWNIPDEEDAAVKHGTPKNANRRELDTKGDTERGPGDKRFISNESMMSMSGIDEEIADTQGSETHRDNTTGRSTVSDPSVTEESLSRHSGSERGTPINNHSDSGESSIMTSDDSLSPIPIAKPGVPKQNLGGMPQEGLTPIEEGEGSSPKLQEDATPEVVNSTSFNPNSDSGESTILTSDDSAISISPLPVAKPPILKQSTPKQNPSSVPPEGLAPIDEGAAMRQTPDLEEEDPMPQVVQNDPWVRMMERRDIQIDHMDTDFLCLWSKPSMQTVNNVIGNSSFSEDETIQSQHDLGAPMTPEALLGSDNEDNLQSRLAAKNLINVPDLNLHTRHIQGTSKENGGSQPDIKSNMREINALDGSISSNDNERTIEPTFLKSAPQHGAPHLDSVGHPEVIDTTYVQGSQALNDQLSSTRGNDDSRNKSVVVPQHQQTEDIETAGMDSIHSITVRASGAAARVDRSTDFSQSAVSSNGWESTASSSLGEPYQDLENSGVDSDDDGPPHLFSDDEFSYGDEHAAVRPGVSRSRHSEVLVDIGPNRPAPRSSETTVVRGSRTQKKDSDRLVRERHGIATGRASGDGSAKRELAPQELGMSPRKMQIAIVLFISFLLGAGTFWYVWATYLTDDTEVQAVEGPFFQPTPPPTVIVRETETPSWSPSFEKTESPFVVLRDLLVSAWPSLESGFADPSSPQFKALLWLQSNLVDSYDSQQKIQRFVLAVLFYSTNGEGWINKGSWLTDADECEWNLSNSFRPPCNEEGLYVYLELNSNGLSGSIPSELALLSNSLVRLELSQDGSSTSVISGSIPPELGELTLLESVSLANNALTGQLPVEIGKWTMAAAVDLRANQLRGAIPTEVASLTSLTSLSLQNNQFTLLPRQIGDLSTLRQLDASFNRIRYLPAEIGNLSLLRRLDLSHNQIQSSIPSAIGALTDLISLDLSSNLIVETIPSEMGNMVRLRDALDLSNNRLSGNIPSELSGAILLRNLMLHNNTLIGTIPASFKALSRLTTFRVEANDLTGIVSGNICDVFEESVPVFVSDCIVELDCPCCMFCCEDPGVCQCQLEGELEFLCLEYTTTFGTASLGLN
ncbi:MAG: hypothetical protein SGBAC_003196 [Bacillariaceae sp.]